MFLFKQQLVFVFIHNGVESTSKRIYLLFKRKKKSLNVVTLHSQNTSHNYVLFASIINAEIKRISENDSYLTCDILL